MGTAHGAEELGLWPHGHACQAGAWGRYIGFCLGYGHIWGNSILKRPAKIFLEAHNFVLTLSHDGILTNGLLRLKRGTLDMRIAVSRE
jgi:hypothetical protein